MKINSGSILIRLQVENINKITNGSCIGRVGINLSVKKIYGVEFERSIRNVFRTSTKREKIFNNKNIGCNKAAIRYKRYEKIFYRGYD